ncbi:dihydropteroate synthase [Halalkalicoccus jeotgali]|uniref:dihydropteroate synthase n=1 Tax=Halalkalicoccus jeotgali (strain DSM 18796 / CECT 7217 / JCM 14584 / KCTC 4019 / B3) TaxID=795797 RepID=D8J2E8_HALJB|nr:dihydropteroate synthase [Halalkalicoccus jeotgali]ADJ14905.1 dihydropteroate synthase [Halalkalicoccus jeotgali B3]ELY39487.1 dihydropteroate synthase [Halalkalicoccus jeotgali B3]
MQTVEAAGLGIGDDHPPRIMGVLNVSEESPYDPSVFADPGEAAAYVERELIEEGADIVDVGLESANKRLDVLSPEAELDRLDTAVETLESVSSEAVFSIETRYSEVADAALSRGFDMVNDVCGFADPAMPETCRAHDAAVVKMASPPDLERPGAVESVDGIYEALSMNGFTEKTILDPAFGGWSPEKSLADDRETLSRLREFRAYGRPLLVSINRKNFLRDIAGRSTEKALPVSLAATAMAVERGAHVLRTHDVAETRDAALIGREFSRERVREPTVEELDVTSHREAARHLERVDGDAELADAGVTRWFRLSDLGDAAQALALAVADTEGVSLAGTDPTLLFGTRDGFASLNRAVPAETGPLPELLSKILDDFS